MKGNTLSDLVAEPHRRREIVAHFAGRATPVGESAMRAHLQVCVDCRKHYERALLLAHLDPRGLTAMERIGRGLGFSGRGSFHRGSASRPRARFVLTGFLAAAVGAAAVLVVARANFLGPTPPFTARGPGTAPPAATTATFWTYRIAAASPPILEDRTIGPDDELAFAYSNLLGKPYLMLFGVDEHRHVYWFHPPWPTGAPAPRAVAAASGAGPHELPGAIRHRLDGRRLDVYAVFADTALDVGSIERGARASAAPEEALSFGPGTVTVRRAFEVR